MMTNKTMSQTLLDARFLKADRLKVSKYHYAIDMDSCILNGRTEIVEKVLNKHLAEPYGSIEELIGDLQIELVNSWNTFHKLWPKQTMPIGVERILKEQGYYGE